MNTPLSAIIITLNEEHNIQRCLDSVRFCDEIIVIDSGSQDNTINIAIASGATVIHQDWLGYGKQKQFAVNQAKHDWVLCIDADEVVSEALKQSIVNDSHITNGMVTAYKMPRKNHFLGKPLLHGEGYPDFSLRLFNKLHCHWSDDEVHEGVVVVNGQINKLTGDLLHFSEETLSKYIAKQNHYTQLQADILFEQGKQYHPLKCVSSPLIRFIKFYFLRLGFLDGAPGFIHIIIGCFNAFCKYAKLVELHRRPPTQHTYKK
jgi:glycosyltransferase involved in cell wall biosynthesis